MTDSAKTVYDLPLYLAGAQVENIEKANKRAARAGIKGQYEWHLTGTYQVKHGNAIETRATIEVIGELLHIGSYRFAATIDWSVGAPLVNRNRMLPSDIVLTAPDTKRCEHCGTERERKDTYLVIDDEGTIKQVGRSCLKAYTGIEPSWVYAVDIEEVEDCGWDSYPRDEMRWSPEHVVALSSAVVQLWGYTSVRDAEIRGGMTTGNLMRGILSGDRSFTEERKAAEALLDEARCERAREVLAWAASQEGTSEYESNLRVLGAAESIGYRHVGMVASFIVAHDRELLKRKEQSERGPVPTGRVAIEGEIVSVRVKDNPYGNEGDVTVKAWVQLDNGSRVYVTVPAALQTWTVTRDFCGAQDEELESLRGRRVAMTVTIEAAQDDPTKGFGSRPAKAAFVQAVPA